MYNARNYSSLKNWIILNQSMAATYWFSLLKPLETIVLCNTCKNTVNFLLHHQGCYVDRLPGLIPFRQCSSSMGTSTYTGFYQSPTKASKLGGSHNKIITQIWSYFSSLSFFILVTCEPTDSVPITLCHASSLSWWCYFIHSTYYFWGLTWSQHTMFIQLCQPSQEQIIILTTFFPL